MGLLGPYWTPFRERKEYFSSKKKILLDKNIFFFFGKFLSFRENIRVFVLEIEFSFEKEFLFNLNVELKRLGVTPPDPALYGPSALTMRALRALLPRPTGPAGPWPRAL